MTVVFCSKDDTSRSGFTLVEMAVVLVVMGLVMLTVLPALNTVRSANQLSLTQSNLRSLMLATAAYVQANGCLPCPAATSGTGFGTETSYIINTSGKPTPNACGICSSPEGIPPYVSLGLPASTAHDGWGHWITMRVDPALTNPANCGTASNSCSNYIFIPPTALCTTADYSSGYCAAQSGSPVGYSDKGLCKYNLSAASNAVPITVSTPNGTSQKAAVIFVSYGSTGYGSYVASLQQGWQMPFPSPPNNPSSATYNPCSAYSGYPKCNAAGTANFVDAMTVVGDTDPYDDVLAYADRNALVSMFGNGACNTTW
ncbi:MAG: prepilin-type N-terminal cleavage/methylation domain-containing protein [Alphaproteobacteria bacterium]|nr:prepilin-type N-terminal cleavage/methylation domain-containing protein [Alphaproteobacteria bacterium]